MAIDPADTSDSRLPDDLVFIGEQLWEDADHLVRTYPANAPQNWRRAFAVAVMQKTDTASSGAHPAIAKHVKIRPAAYGGVVAAAAMAVIAVGWYSASLHPRGGTSRNPATAQQGHPESHPPRVITAGVDVIPGLGADVWRTDTLTRRAVILPAGPETLDYFSPTEQEALLDVFSKNQIPEPSVEY